MEEEYFNLINQETKEKIEKFVKFHQEKRSKLVLITSGGTTVPLEEKTVRFIDNFSEGTRGSASAEYFIDKSYAVLFLYRKRSLKPYQRLLSKSNPLEYLIPNEENPGEFRINQNIIHNFEKIFKCYQNAVKELEFITLFDYFSHLRYLCKAVSCLGQKCLVYLPAAVSDFYLPKSQISQHKIQSSDYQSLHLDLRPVPKLLGLLKTEWCPQAFVVSFKLETDPSLLFGKCHQSLEKYKHNCVVGNLLEDRKAKVVVFDSKDRIQEIKTHNGVEIETLLVDYLMKLHSEYLENN